MPGAAIVTLDMATWLIPFVAAVCIQNKQTNITVLCE